MRSNQWTAWSATTMSTLLSGMKGVFSAYGSSNVPLEWPFMTEPRAIIPDERLVPSTLANDRGR